MAAGTGTTALMLRSAWLLHWLNYGHQLTAIAAYRYETDAAGGAAEYLFILIWFPVIGLFMSTASSAPTQQRTSSTPRSGRTPQPLNS